MRISVARIKALASVGLSQREAADALGVGRRVVRDVGVQFCGAPRYRRRTREEACAFLAERLAAARSGTVSSR